MTKLYRAALFYMILGLAAGLYYRTLTHSRDFSGQSQLSVAHTHLLALGMLFFLVVLALEKLFTLSKTGLFTLFFWVLQRGFGADRGDDDDQRHPDRAGPGDLTGQRRHLRARPHPDHRRAGPPVPGSASALARHPDNPRRIRLRQCRPERPGPFRRRGGHSMSIQTPAQVSPRPADAPLGRGRRLAAVLASRRGAWIVLVLAVLVLAGLSGALGTSDPPGAGSSLPASQSADVRELQKQFPNAELAPVMAVATRADGQALTSDDRDAVTSIGAVLSRQVGQAPSPLIRSADGRAALVSVMIDADRENTEIAGTIDQLRRAVQDQAPAGLTVQITGGPAFGADIAAAFGGANFTLLAVTVAVVALLLLLTYRSPVLWLIPLVVVGVADQVANTVTAWMGQTWNLSFDAGIISVLVFGAGTNYALLLISRYREELHHTTQHRAALTAAWRGTAPAIVASNVTVVLSLLTLVFAAMPSTRGLGIASAAGLVIALIFALLVLPAALAVTGRRVFWPFVPRAGSAAVEGGPWLKVARGVTQRPVAVIAVSAAVLAVFSAGLLGTRVGLSQTEQFRVPANPPPAFTLSPSISRPASPPL